MLNDNIFSLSSHIYRSTHTRKKLEIPIISVLLHRNRSFYFLLSDPIIGLQNWTSEMHNREVDFFYIEGSGTWSDQNESLV